MSLSAPHHRAATVQVAECTMIALSDAIHRMLLVERRGLLTRHRDPVVKWSRPASVGIGVEQCKCGRES